MTAPARAERNTGIDALRIVCMFAVLLFHIFDFGLDQAVGSGVWPAWLLRSATFGAVDCYGMISGFVHWNRKVRWRQYIMLWLQVWFYSVLILGAFALFRADLITEGSIPAAFFPVFSRQYWYFTAYSAVFLLMPLLNSAIQGISAASAKAFLGFGLLFFAAVPALGWIDPFYTEQGKSALWLILMYLAGGLISRFDLGKKLSTVKWLLIWIGCVWLAVLTIPIMARLSSLLYQDGRLTDRFLGHQSPLVVLNAAILLILFSRWKPGRRLTAAIAFIAPLTFAVYLIHVHPLVWSLLPESCLFMTAYPWPVMILMAIGTALAVMLLCMGVDWLRLSLFRAAKLAPRLDRLEDRLRSRLTGEAD